MIIKMKKRFINDQADRNGFEKSRGGRNAAGSLIGRLVCNQISHFNVQVITEFADQAGIQPLKVIAAIAIKIGAWDIQIFADPIFGNAPGFEDPVDIKFQSAVSHRFFLQPYNVII